MEIGEVTLSPRDEVNPIETTEIGRGVVREEALKLMEKVLRDRAKVLAAEVDSWAVQARSAGVVYLMIDD